MLVILDGFGIGRDRAVDAIAAARMPVWRGLLRDWPHAVLGASEEAVGLPVGQMGNSEVGHLNLGAGRPVRQDLPRIDAAIADGSFATCAPLVEACRRAARPGGRLHLVSLVGPGGVHANDRHLVAIVELASALHVPSVRVHALLDGRDTPPRSGRDFTRDLEARLAKAHPDARIASVGGRYFAMDRDARWDRVERGYDAMANGAGERAPSATAAIDAAYARGEDDEFVTPTVVEGVDGTLRSGDPVIHCNFRADRARQLTRALANPSFDGFDRAAPDGRPPPDDLLVVTLTQYEDGLPVAVAFPPEATRSLAEAFSEAGWRQLHVAETEKYAHVTYFFNGGVERPYPGEDRELIPSLKVATYDLAPAMRAEAITDAVVAAIVSGQYDFIVANFANPDMIGHTGRWEATIAALEVLDACLGRIVPAIEGIDAANAAKADDPAPGADADAGTDGDDAPGALLAITADHGNADELRDDAGNPATAHSLNPVPFVLVGRVVRGRGLADGVLADVAPTLLEFAGLPRWAGMTGRSRLL